MRILATVVLMTVFAFGYENVSAKEFAALVKQKDIVLLDVRTPSEFSTGHIEGANLIPLQLFKYIFLGGKGLKEKKLLVYCRSGHRSAEASRLLESWGVKEVYNLKDGILSWRAAGLPLEK